MSHAAALAHRGKPGCSASHDSQDGRKPVPPPRRTQGPAQSLQATGPNLQRPSAARCFERVARCADPQNSAYKHTRREVVDPSSRVDRGDARAVPRRDRALRMPVNEPHGVLARSAGVVDEARRGRQHEPSPPPPGRWPLGQTAESPSNSPSGLIRPRASSTPSGSRKASTRSACSRGRTRRGPQHACAPHRHRLAITLARRSVSEPSRRAALSHWTSP